MTYIYIYIYIREHLGWVFVRGPFGLPSTRYVRIKKKT